jgi:hypothetical protein
MKTQMLQRLFLLFFLLDSKAKERADTRVILSHHKAFTYIYLVRHLFNKNECQQFIKT